MHKHNAIFWCVAALLVGGPSSSLAAAQQPAAAAAPQGKSDATSPVTFILGPDDQIVITAVDVPDISGKTQRLDPNGDLRLPMIGRVHAAGMTVPELEAELTKRLKVFLQEPDVSVTVTEFRSQPVSVIGAVGTSGVRQLEGRKTLVELLSMAGGLTADAGPVVRVTRRLDRGRIPLPEATDDPTGGFSTVDIDAKALLESRSPEKDITIQPYDVIAVPRADIVYVIGEVGKPGLVPLSGGQSISVMEAVSSSGGVLRTAAPSRARILRRIPGQDARMEVNVDLQKMMNGKASDLPLRAGDILVVPDSSGKRAATRAIEAAIQVATMMGTYSVIR